MTSTKSPPTPKTPEISYPCLMRHIAKEFVVMFSDKTKGMVIHDPNKSWSIGHHSDIWHSAEGSDWTPETETINLSN